MTELMDAPNTTVDFREDVERPLQAIPKSRLRARAEQVALAAFIVVPLACVAVAGWVAWGGWLSWRDVVISFVAYAITGHGITVGFHRYFTHGSFKAGRTVKVLLAIAGSMAVEGPVTRWVADHRRHHAYSDKEGDPHSPWRYGESFPALCKGLWHAHIGWLFDVEQTDQHRFAPDLKADRDVDLVNKLFPLWVLLSLGLPPLVGGLWAGSWQGALTAFFWASVVRMAVLHHATWSINSICHTLGERPVQDPRQGDQRLAAGADQHGRELAQPAPRRPDRGPPRRRPLADRHQRRAHPRPGEAGPRDRRPLAQPRAARRPPRGPRVLSAEPSAAPAAEADDRQRAS